MKPRTKRIAMLLVVLVSLLLTSSALAMASPSYHLDWFVPLSGGGEETASENYVAHFTYGQATIGSGESSGYRASLGFWHGVLQLTDGFWRHVFMPLMIK